MLFESRLRPKFNNTSTFIYIIIGGYETGHAEYKHFYFNCNRNTAIIWTITVLALIGLYEGIKSICRAIYQGKHAILSTQEHVVEFVNI